jgi:hypothetical protein
MKKNYWMFILVVFFVGCAQTQEIGKTLWGSSTRALEDARVGALVKNFACDFDSCFDEVLFLKRKSTQVSTTANDQYTRVANLGLEVPQKLSADIESGIYDVFIEDRIKGHIVVVGIEGNVDTTEVGIFFSEYDSKITTIEVSSLSTTAREKVSEAVFSHLSSKFQEIP